MKWRKDADKLKKKNGAQAEYIPRTHALRDLQVSLPDFRRMCILKGIFPREPNKEWSGKNKTYYLRKDIKILKRDPLLQSLRTIHTMTSRIRGYIHQHEDARAEATKQRLPSLRLDRIVKERYPTFIDAVKDLDDALSLLHLFAIIPQKSGIELKTITESRRLVREFDMYVLLSNSLRKSFVTVKGIYYEADIQGTTVRWLEPHDMSAHLSTNVDDLSVMLHFTELYRTLVAFVNYRLFSSLSLEYPPLLDKQREDSGLYFGALQAVERSFSEQQASSTPSSSSSSSSASESKPSVEVSASLSKTISRIQKQTPNAEEDEEEAAPAAVNPLGEADEFPLTDEERAAREHLQREAEAYKTLFKDCKFFLSREVPKRPLEFIIRSFGGRVSYDVLNESLTPYPESDPSITHQIVDRPALRDPVYPGREYVQPQWVFDCANNRFLLPIALYAIGAKLPPHLSPFVDHELTGYTPEYAIKIRALINRSHNPEKTMEEAVADVRREIDSTHLDEEDRALLEEESYRKDMNRELGIHEPEEIEVEDDEDDSKNRKRFRINGNDDDEDDEAEEEEEEEEEEQQPKKKTKMVKVQSAAEKIEAKQKQQAMEEVTMRRSMASNKMRHVFDRTNKGLAKKKRRNAGLESRAKSSKD